MTNREFYAAISTAENLPAELIEKAAELLSKLDASNEKRKGAETKEKKEAAARKEAVLSFVREQSEPVTRDVIADKLNITPSQATAACSSFVRSGVMKKTEVKVEKKPKTVYSIA